MEPQPLRLNVCWVKAMRRRTPAVFAWQENVKDRDQWKVVDWASQYASEGGISA